jgi:hypothetical protein
MNEENDIDETGGSARKMTPEQEVKFDILFAHCDKIYKVFLVETRKYERLLESASPHNGRILTCHLIVERYVDQLFVLQMEDEKVLDKVNLNFTQKLAMLSTKHKYYQYLIPQLKELNTVRNKLVHRLDHVVEPTDIPNIKGVCNQINELKRAEKVLPNPSIEDQIELFTKWFATVASLHLGGMKLAVDQLFAAFPKLEQYLRPDDDVPNLLD